MTWKLSWLINHWIWPTADCCVISDSCFFHAPHHVTSHTILHIESSTFSWVGGVLLVSVYPFLLSNRFGELVIALYVLLLWSHSYLLLTFTICSGSIARRKVYGPRHKKEHGFTASMWQYLRHIDKKVNDDLTTMFEMYHHKYRNVQRNTFYHLAPSTRYQV